MGTRVLVQLVKPICTLHPDDELTFYDFVCGEGHLGDMAVDFDTYFGQLAVPYSNTASMLALRDEVPYPAHAEVLVVN